MNNMKNQSNSKSVEKNLQVLSSAVGDFIRYWGFRRIHGQLWTQIYLSTEPLSGADLTRRLKVSKALVSPALGELLSYGLIEIFELDGKTKVYKANPDVFSVIKNILKSREATLIEKAHASYLKLDNSLGKDRQEIDRARLEQLREMIESAQFALQLVLQDDELNFNAILTEKKR